MPYLTLLMVALNLLLPSIRGESSDVSGPPPRIDLWVQDSEDVPPREPRFNLHRARPDVEAELVWPLKDDAGHGLTGEGILICDMDAPPDIFHPMFFKADRGRFNWIDLDGDGTWSPGDAVDIDGDGVPGPEERLAWLPYAGDDIPGLDPSRFQVGFDFLYQDANGNGQRDFGPPAFKESDPCYGEGLFLVDDANGNERLDAGETLTGLKTSKVRAINFNRVYRRGVDLIDYPYNIFSRETHGTLVSGVLIGGWPGRHRLTGVAPDAELINAGRNSDALSWAQAEGADVILWEFGGQLSDGSSQTELHVNELAREGIIFVAAAGNDRAPERHILFSDSETETLGNRDSTGISLVFSWRGPGPDRIQIQSPGDSGCILPFQRSYLSGVCVQGFMAYSDPSPRGTTYLSLDLHALDNIGDWTFRFPGFTGEIHGFSLYDFDSPGASWVGGDGAYTVTSPGAADSAITVAAYENYPPGDIAWFSGEGPRPDGRPVVDIAAPGVGVISAVNGARFAAFTGTSAAIPFVAGAAALLKQAFPGLNSGRFRSLIRSGAASDSLTTDENRWGAGRLRIHAALLKGLENPIRVGQDVDVRVFPNPSRGSLEFMSFAVGTEVVEVRIFSATGALIWETRVHPEAGLVRVQWSGENREDRPVPSGVFFVHLKQGQHVGVAQFVHLR